MANNDYYSRKVADSISAMLAYWDKDQICRFANRAYMEWFGKDSDDMINKITLKELLGPLYQKNLPYIEGAYRGNIQVFERDIPTPDGDIRNSIATYTPDIIDGEVQGIIVHVANVTYIKKIETELKIAKEKAEELATHDFLTGLPNRILLNDRFLNAISLAERNGLKIALCMMDMDDFKNINDTYGHQAGDNTLKEIAERTKSAMREYDTLSRIGGDEFVILLINIESRDMIDITLNRILHSFKKPAIISGEDVQISISIGVSVYPDDGKNPDQLLRKADKALYVSKNAGKNRFSYFVNHC